MTFRRGFLCGIIVALVVAIYLARLWQPNSQVELHTAHLVRQIERRNGAAVRNFIAADYRDDWEHDRERLIERLRELLGYARGIQIIPLDPQTKIDGHSGSWKARICANGGNAEVVGLIRSELTG